MAHAFGAVQSLTFLSPAFRRARTRGRIHASLCATCRLWNNMRSIWSKSGGSSNDLDTDIELECGKAVIKNRGRVFRASEARRADRSNATAISQVRGVLSIPPFMAAS